MPHYEFFCSACKQTFSKILTITEHDAEKTGLPALRQSRGRTTLVCLFCHHLEEERLNTAAPAGAYALQTNFPPGP